MSLKFLLFFFALNLITGATKSPVEIKNESQGKIYLYYDKSTTRKNAMEVCAAKEMKLLSVEKSPQKSWWEKIFGKVFYKDTDKTISAFVCEKNDVMKINNFSLKTDFSSGVREISNFTGNRIACAVYCSDILHCDIFTYLSNTCRLYFKNPGKRILPCHELQCYVKIQKPLSI